MEDKNELSDIVLEKDDNKALKTKRILIIVALMILLFLLVLVITKAIQAPDNNTQNPKVILPPTPSIKTVETKKDEQLFKQVPIIEEENDKKESFEEMVKSLKEKEIQKEKEIVQKETPKVEPKVVKQVEKTTPAPKVKKVVAKEQPKAVPSTPKTTQQTESTVATTGVYIQVGATSRLSPNKKFLNTITSRNYKYRLLPITVKDKKVTKILIGPYTNSTAAKEVMADIKANINKDAFIYRVK